MEPLAAELPLPEFGRGIFEREPELADAARALGPARRIAGQIGEMLLILEARHGIVRLRLEIDAQQAPLGRRIEERQPRAGDEIVHQRGDEHRLARAREPGHAEFHIGRDKVGGEVADAAQGIARGVAIGGNRHASNRPLRSRSAWGVARRPLTTA